MPASFASEVGSPVLTTIEKVLLLQGVDIFLETKTESLAKVAAITQEVHFEQGTTIFAEGDPSDALYVIVNGAVSLRKDSQGKGTVRERETFGMWALLDESPRLVTAVALTDTTALKIEREALYEVLSDHFDIVRGIFKCLVRMIRRYLEK